MHAAASLVPRGYAAAVYSTSVEKLTARHPAQSSTEHVFSYGDKMKTGTAKVGSLTQNIERKRARFQEKYSKGGITRAAVNENVRTPTLSMCR